MEKQKFLKTKIEFFVIDEVRKIRIKCNLSQSELAYRLGVSPGFIGKVESQNSRSKYNLNHINKLSEIFNCIPKYFLPNKKL